MARWYEERLDSTLKVRSDLPGLGVIKVIEGAWFAVFLKGEDAENVYFAGSAEDEAHVFGSEASAWRHLEAWQEHRE